MAKMRFFLLIALPAWLSGAPLACAQEAKGAAQIHLSAALAAAAAPLKSGLHWRLYSAKAEADGSYALVQQSDAPEPSFSPPPGDYVIHVAFGLASSVKMISVGAEDKSDRLTINAGALRIGGVLGDAPIDPAKLSISIFVPRRNNPEAKLVYSKPHAGDLIGLPEGSYHIESTFLDTVGVGSIAGGKAPSAATPTNSIINADIKLPAGKVIDLTLRHRYATLTLKLVNAQGGEALANSNFTVLTPGGDPIRELIGAFPSLVLAEGEYVVVARHDSKTFQSTFQVQSGQDRDVEVLAQNPTQ